MLVPSIDLSNGKAVQLRQGKELVLESDRDPVELAREFNRYGEVAVIDLDAALGKGDNRELLKRMCAVADVRAGGGIRDAESGRELLRAGAKSIIIGTKATPDFLSQFPRDKVIVALDNVDNEVVDRGWTNSTGESIWDRAQRLNDFCNGYLVTFVRSEGTMTGLPVKSAQEVKERLKLPVTVAGGIANADEVVQLSQLGLDVQVGMALYQGKLQPADCVVESVKFDEKGLVPTIVQDTSGQVLMLAYSNKESLKRALTEGEGIYFSRSRQEIWQKGATSGNTQRLISCRIDCDRDTVLFKVEQQNAACHRDSYSCFGNASAAENFSMTKLFEVLEQRKADAPEGSYSTTLFQDRRKLMKKLMEEAHEVATFESRENLKWEIADLLYFVSVLAVDEGLTWQQIEAELGGRKK